MHPEFIVYIYVFPYSTVTKRTLLTNGCIMAIEVLSMYTNETPQIRDIGCFVDLKH